MKRKSSWVRAARVVLPIAVIVALIATMAFGSMTKVPSSRGARNEVAPGAQTGSQAGTSAGATQVDSMRFGVAASASYTSWVKQRYPKQASARQVSGNPATYYWALLIGINDYAGSTESNVGSKQDAQQLSQYLISQGWRSDHIMLMTDSLATASHIVDGMRWLESKTTSASVAVFHYAGHENWKTGKTERRDVAIWAYDNRLIYDDTVGKELGRVSAGRMWIHFATCRAGGFTDAGMVKSGRILTFSSPESEFSYEDPRLHHSVFGYFVISEGFVNKHADANHNGTISVEEAFSYAKSRTTKYTQGAQHPMVIDKYSGGFSLKVPKQSSSGSSSQPSPTPTATEPQTCVVVCL